MTISKISKLVPQTSALFVCDVQERFKGLIWQYPSVISVAGKMVMTKNRKDIVSWQPPLFYYYYYRLKLANC
jgi:hypothetical protein